MRFRTIIQLKGIDLLQLWLCGGAADVKIGRVYRKAKNGRWNE